MTDMMWRSNLVVLLLVEVVVVEVVEVGVTYDVACYCVVAATSGDTGSSALMAMSSVDKVDVVVLLPKNRCSEAQELQMTSVVSDNCHVIRGEFLGYHQATVH